jgi:hypothetical protein
MGYLTVDQAQRVMGIDPASRAVERALVSRTRDGQRR